MSHSYLLILLGGIGAGHVAALQTRDPPPYFGASEVAFKALQSWYNTKTGLWDTTNWWNGANCLTVIADLLAVDGNIEEQAKTVFTTTFTKAQTTPSKLRSKRYIPGLELESSGLEERGFKGFINDYYDDEAWWALAWISVYDWTHDQQYLDMADEVFQDMRNGWSGNCTFDGVSGGGIWWNKKHQQINSIANTLYLSVAAHLANRLDDKQTYVDIAESTWQWLGASNLQNSSHLFTDKLDLSSCKPTGGDGWSYNQGVIVGGLVELASATGNNDYLTSAREIASAEVAMRQNTTGGIARDNCEPDNCSGDQTQFKGVYMRNLAKLWKVGKEQEYKDFIIANADSIMAHDTSDGKLGLQYTGPFVKADASTQSSAMDALVAAIVVSA